jgi:hypothetical protein
MQMRRKNSHLIPYAGYDRGENMKGGRQPKLNLQRINELRDMGHTYRVIGEILATEEGRISCYTYDAIYAAIRKATKHV